MPIVLVLLFGNPTEYLELNANCSAKAVRHYSTTPCVCCCNDGSSTGKTTTTPQKDTYLSNVSSLIK